MSDDIATPPPIGIQLYTVRDHAAADLAGVLARLDDMGFLGVELAGFHGHPRRAVHEAIATTSLDVVSAHVGLADDDSFGRALADHRALGCDTAVVPSAPHDGFGSLDGVKQTAELLNHANDLAREHGMALGYHNHYWELRPLADGRPALLHLFDHVAPEVFAEVDIYWARVGGVDPADLVAELGSRARLLHVKDGPADDPASANVAVGDGAIDTAAVLAAATGARWHLVEFDRCETDLFAALEQSVAYLTGHGLSRARP